MAHQQETVRNTSKNSPICNTIPSKVLLGLSNGQLMKDTQTGGFNRNLSPVLK